MACPGYHYHRKAFLAYKRGRKTDEKRGGERQRGRRKNTGRERRPQHQQSLLPESSFFPFVFLLPLSRPKNTPAPLPFHLFFIPSSSSLSQPPAASLVLEISVTEPPSLQQTFPLINSPPFSPTPPPSFLSSSSFSHTPRYH